MTPDNLLKSLSDSTRLRIALLLVLKPQAEICVCDLISVLDMQQAKVSRHLAVLRKNHIVSSQKRGQWVYYQINHEMPAWALTILDNLIVGGKSVELLELDRKALEHTQSHCVRLNTD